MTAKPRYIVFEQHGGEISRDFGYLNETKPFHRYGNRQDAHLFTLKQAQAIVFSLNRNARRSPYCTTRWGYERVA